MSSIPEGDWIRMYRETVRPLYGFVARRAGERELAEDVTQETWLRAVESWRRKGPPEEPLAWLESVAANLLRNHFRRLRPGSLDAQELQIDLEAERVTGGGATALLQWGLARLRAGQARLIERRHLDGRGLRELAEETGLSERAVEGRLRRARRDLERVLSPYLRDRGARA